MSDLISKQAAVEAIASEARRIREDIVHHAETDYLVGLHRAERIVSKLEPETQPAPTAPDLLAKLDRAHQVVTELCEGKRRWTMSVPARPDHDPDLIISDALHSAREALSASSPVVPRSGMCEDGNTHFCHGCGKNLVGSSPLPPAQEPKWGDLFSPCDGCKTATHCAHYRRCLAECTPDELVTVALAASSSPPQEGCGCDWRVNPLGCPHCRPASPDDDLTRTRRMLADTQAAAARLAQEKHDLREQIAALTGQVEFWRGCHANACKRAEGETRWQPISEAPKDGSVILLWPIADTRPILGACRVVDTGYWDTEPEDEGGQCWRDIECRDRIEPTHWMPLPAVHAGDKP